MPSRKKKPAVLAPPGPLEFSRDGRDIWEQQEGEPPAAYLRFVAYLRCGPARKVPAVFALFAAHEQQEQARLAAGPSPAAVVPAGGPGGPGGAENPSMPPPALDAYALAQAPPGLDEGAAERKAYGADLRQWKREAAAYRWEERAVACDTDMLLRDFRTAGMAMGKLVAAFALKMLRTAMDPRIKPETWKEWQEGVHGLAQLVPQGAVAALLPDAGDDAGPEAAGPVIDAPGPVGEGPGGLHAQRAEIAPDAHPGGDQPDGPGAAQQGAG